jgi:formylglycine-generating enzyme required for sulfatase activity
MTALNVTKSFDDAFEVFGAHVAERLGAARAARLAGLAAICVMTFGCASGPPMASRLETGIGLVMIRIEPRPFTMGSPEGEVGRQDNETQHWVTISKPYWIGETEVTEAQWTAVMGVKPWGPNYEQAGDHYPATLVSWTDAVAFCAELTKRERAVGRLPLNYTYALPSEAEWEYACRGGATTAFCHGDDEQQLTDYAVLGHAIEKGRSAAPVRTKKANAFGLYDMHGNVWEWCADHADWTSQVVNDTYRDGVADPLSYEGSLRVTRGGGWGDIPVDCRSAFRGASVASAEVSGLGFRPVIVARPLVR